MKTYKNRLKPIKPMKTYNRKKQLLRTVKTFACGRLVPAAPKRTDPWGPHGGTLFKEQIDILSCVFPQESIICQNIKNPSKQSRNLSNHDFQEKSKNRPEQSKKLSKNNQNFPKTIPKQSKNHQKPLKMIKNIEFHLQIYI